MPQKLHVESKPAESDKAVPVAEVFFTHPIKWPGIAGAGMSIRAGGSKGQDTRSNVLHVDTIFLYRGKFVVDGKFFMSENASAILTYNH